MRSGFCLKFSENKELERDADSVKTHRALIEKTLGIELEPGNVILSDIGQKHVLKSHGADFLRCLPFVGDIIKDPTYVGDDLQNRDKIELVGRMPGGDGLLVAIAIIRDVHGFYRVASFYPVTQQKIDTRRSRHLLKNAVRN